MSDSRDVKWTIAVVIFALCYAATFVAIKLSAAQEKDSSYPPTRSWVITVEDAHIVVIDTAGVCLYVGSNGFAKPDAIAAVPKTQLPRGAGCQ